MMVYVSQSSGVGRVFRQWADPAFILVMEKILDNRKIKRFCNISLINDQQQGF